MPEGRSGHVEAETTKEGFETTIEEEAEFEAVYALERAVKCPSCAATVRILNVVRTLRSKVNFTSNLPRRGYVMTCPDCQVIVSANIGTKVF
jgi:hypothetical protein